MTDGKILVKTTFPSVIHNDEISNEIVKWGKANGYPVHKAKLVSSLEAYVAFAPAYFIAAKRQPPIPGGWDVTVESFVPETRDIPVNVKKMTAPDGSVTYEINKFILKMIDEYIKEGLQVQIGEDVDNSYGFLVRTVHCTGNSVLLDNFENFVEDMR